jgi:type II secretory pathway pseudopilin PulG
MKIPVAKRARRSEAGMSLIELMIALGILLVVSIGILSMAMISITTTENQGHLAARTAEYAQDKMEQLMGLAFADCKAGSPAAQCTDTTTIDTTTNSYSLGTGGTGLAAGGSLTTATSGYVDYLDGNGNPLGGGATAPSNWSYQRLWAITDVSATLKQISVKVNARSGAGGPSVAPNATVTSLKSSPF